MQGQNAASAVDDAQGQSRQPRDLNAIAAVGTSGFDAPKEYHIVAGFLHRNVKINDAIELSGQFGQFMIVSREERLRADALVDVLDHRPGQRKTVVGGSAAADFIQNDEAARRRGVEDHSGLGHLHHEGGSAARQIVGRANACKHAVDNGQHGGLGGHERSHLGKDCDERRLTKISRFATHVRSGDDGDEFALRLQVQIVRDKPDGFARGQRLDHRVTPGNDAHLTAIGKRWPAVPVARGNFGERGGYIQFGDRSRGCANASRQRCRECASLLEDLALQSKNLVLGIEDLALQFLQFGRGETFGIHQRLLALVVGRGQMQIGFGDLDVISEYIIEANLERLNTGACALARFDLRDVLFAIAADVAQLIQLGIVTISDRAPIGEIDRWLVGDRGQNPFAQLRHFVEFGAQALQPLALQIRCALGQRWYRSQRSSKGQQFPWTGGSQRELCGEPLEIENTGQNLTNLGAGDRRG